jgi:hypothetical protein
MADFLTRSSGGNPDLEAPDVDFPPAAGPAPGETTPLLGDSAGGGGAGDGPQFLQQTSPAKFRAVFSQVLLSQFVSGFDSTVMASAHTVITSHFGAARSASWLSTSFLLALTATQPFLGRLTDVLGRKTVFLACLSLLAVATAACSLAWSIRSLIVARALCGSVAGGLSTVGAIITSDLVPVEYVPSASGTENKDLPPFPILQAAWPVPAVHKPRIRYRLCTGSRTWRHDGRGAELEMDIRRAGSRHAPVLSGICSCHPKQPRDPGWRG